MNKDLDLDLLDSLPQSISMKTKVWGPAAWFFLHNVVMAYPKKIDPSNKTDLQIKNNMYSFLSNFGNILPCSICGDSYNEYIKEERFNINNALTGRKELIYWLYIIHERVNDKLGVPKCDRLSFNEVIKKYYPFIAKNGCKATTKLERIKKRQIGCTDDDFKDYKCLIDIQENGNIKEEFSGKNNKSNLLMYLFIIVLLMIITYLIIKIKKLT